MMSASGSKTFTIWSKNIPRAQKQIPDCRERAHRLEVADASAVAAWRRAFQAGQVLIREEDVAQFTAKAVASLDHLVIHDDAAAKPGADDGRDRRLAFVSAEDRDVPPQRARVAVVEVGDRASQLRTQRRRQVQTGPSRVHEVGGTLRAQHAGRAGGPRRVQADDSDIVELRAGRADRDGQTILDLLQADGGAFDRARRMLAESVDQEPAVEVEQRVVDGGAAEVNACDNRHPRRSQ